MSIYEHWTAIYILLNTGKRGGGVFKVYNIITEGAMTPFIIWKIRLSSMTFVWQYPRWKHKRKKEGVSNPFWLSKQKRWGFFSSHHIMFRNQVNIIKQALKITGCQPLEAAPLCRDSRPSLISRPPTLLSLLLLCTNRLLCHRCCYFAVTDYSAIADLLCTTLLFLSSRIF